MHAKLLYSGGKDSSLAAYLLKLLGYEVELITANFGVLDSFQPARDAAFALGFPHRVVKFDKSVIEECIRTIIDDGYPKNGINFIHRYVLGETMKDSARVADGTRRDDRVPWLSRKEIRSLEDKYNAEYLTPLRGIGYKTINRLAQKIFMIEEGESEAMAKSDYESEIRAQIRAMGKNPEDYFPEHRQSRVIGWNNKGTMMEEQECRRLI